jgi:hypothetical protein
MFKSPIRDNTFSFGEKRSRVRQVVIPDRKREVSLDKWNKYTQTGVLDLVVMSHSVTLSIARKIEIYESAMSVHWLSNTTLLFVNLSFCSSKQTTVAVCYLYGRVVFVRLFCLSITRQATALSRNSNMHQLPEPAV